MCIHERPAACAAAEDFSTSEHRDTPSAAASWTAPLLSGASPCTTDPARSARLTAMSGMAAMLAHELSQPLTAASNFLSGSSAALRQRIDGLNEVLRMIDEANGQAARVQDLIRRMRTFVINGKVDGRREELAPMLQRAWAMTPGTAGITLDQRLGAGSEFVLADRLQIEQVFGNLLLNAVQALKSSGERRIDVRAAAQSGRVQLTVRDTGPGIDPAMRDTLFEPFATTRPAGMGLGLPICLTIMEAHGGAIWAEPAESGPGAAFTIVLPAAA